MELQNLPLLSYLSIHVTNTDFTSTSGATALRIRRRIHGQQTYTVLTDVTLADAASFDLTLADYYAKAGCTYDYSITPVTASTELVGITGTVVVSFASMFIGNLTEHYITNLNVTVKSKITYAVSYVQPYYSKYPHAVHSGNANHTTGSVDAIFLPKNGQGEYTTVGSREYKDTIIAFLTDGVPKVLKTEDGRAWYVMIDADITPNSEGYPHDESLSFNWTEIGEIPGNGIVVMS